MTDWKKTVLDAIDEFVPFALANGVVIGRAQIGTEFREAPHEPPSRLPAGRVAAYGFFHSTGWLKIGIAGPNSGPRYTSHHYNISAPSSLAKSLVAANERSRIAGLHPQHPGDWIKANTSRVNILLPEKYYGRPLDHLEWLLHVKLEPRFEGRMGRNIYWKLPDCGAPK
jgi:hypothetical protein